MNASATLIILLTFHCVAAQQIPVSDVESLVRSEEAFAAMAKERNTRDAFLYFLADDAITAARANGPRQGKSYLEGQQANESWLTWHPVFTDIAASGDFGYNTGPWQFHPRRDAQPVAFGQFVSMWRKNANGEWRVALDMGISHGKPPGSPPHTSATPASAPLVPGDKEAVFQTERRFIETLSQRNGYAYKDRLSPEARVCRPGYEPILGQEAINQWMENDYTPARYTLMGGEIAASGDLAYAYGRVQLPGDAAETSHSYLRIWKKGNDGWKIAVDLISD
jgi:ketosteroid isomerase-like protein